MYEQEIKRLLSSQLASDIGFCYLGDKAHANFPQLPYAISIVVKLSDAVLSTIEGAPSAMYFQHYRAVNAKLDQLALSVSLFLEQRGYHAFPVAASQSMPGTPFRGFFPHKTAACIAGLGFMGKSGLFLHMKYGSKVRLATVLTDLSVGQASPWGANVNVMTNLCGACTACIEACPAGAITGQEGILVDVEKCSHHMKTYQSVGRGSVCGICIQVCPYHAFTNPKNLIHKVELERKE